MFHREFGRNATFAVAADGFSENTLNSEEVATELIDFGTLAMVNGVNYFRIQQNSGTWSNIVSDEISNGVAATISGMVSLQFMI